MAEHQQAKLIQSKVVFGCLHSIKHFEMFVIGQSVPLSKFYFPGTKVNEIVCSLAY